MLESNVTLLRPVYKLIPLIPDSDLSGLLRVGFELADTEPRLLERIEKDLDAYAIEKKKRRLEDRAWLESRRTPLPGFDVSEDGSWKNNLNLGIGRPRMPAVLVLLFILIRGYLGGFKNKKVTMLLIESRTLEICLRNLGYKLPGFSTIIDNVNAVQPSTLDAFHDAQLRLAVQERLDDFKELTFDSTDVKANSAWPTDSSLMMKLSLRAVHLTREAQSSWIGREDSKISGASFEGY